MIKTLDIAWLAGILEGEGCFILHIRKYPRIQLSMTDEDIIRRVGTFFKSKVFNYPRINPKHKMVWSTYLDGYRAVSWMMTLFTFLGNRRRNKIKEIIKVWKNRSPVDWHEVGCRSWATRQSRMGIKPKYKILT